MSESRWTEVRRIRVALTFLVASAHMLAAQPTPARDARLARVDAYVAAALREWRVPGIAVAIVRNDSVIVAKGYGVRQAGGSDPVDANTIFAVGSVTKAFTAALAAMAVDDGRVKWDDPIATRLPGFALYDPYVASHATLRDALSHRTGLPRGDLGWYVAEFSRAEVLRRVRYLKPASEFRAQFGYQNVMYLAAGEAVARASGGAWDDLVRSRIFGPLGMDRSSTSVARLAGVANVAAPHALGDSVARSIPRRSVDNVAPAGAINSTASDMAQWLRFQLGRGTYAGRRLLSRRNHDEMWAATTAIRSDEYEALYVAPGAAPVAYGLGWFLRDYHGKLVALHDGQIDGFSAMIVVAPDDRVGVVVLTNLDITPAAQTVAYKILDLFTANSGEDLGPTYRAMAEGSARYLAVADAAMERGRGQGASPSLAVAAYAGTYTDSMYGDISVTEKRGALLVRFGNLSGRLEHWQADTFVATLSPARGPATRLGKAMSTFVVDAARGRPAELRLETVPEAVFRFVPAPAQVPPPDSAPGRLVDIGGYRIHLLCRGPSSENTVVLSAGAGDFAVDWWRVQALLSDSVRVCAYDRAGDGWSDPGPLPRSLHQEAAELDLALRRAGERAPFVLVGHSIGGLVVRVYQEEHPGDVVGMVLVAPTSENSRLMIRGQLAQLRTFAQNRPVPPVHSLAEARPSIATGAEATACWAKATADARIFRPFDQLPAQAQRYRLWLLGHPRCGVQEGEDYTPEEAAALAARRARDAQPLGAIPLIVIAPARLFVPPTVSPDAWRQEYTENMSDLSRLSRQGRLVSDTLSGHHVHLDNPRLVVSAIRDVLKAVPQRRH